MANAFPCPIPVRRQEKRLRASVLGFSEGDASLDFQAHPRRNDSAHLAKFKTNTPKAGATAMQCTIVDVFAEAPWSGNQLAVIQGGAHLDTDTMQAIAREMNFSETTFVTGQTSDAARVRIFTPERELPFAGHPTLGTAWVLATAAQDPPAATPGPFTLQLSAGDVPVTFDPSGKAWMTPPPVHLGDRLTLEAAAHLLGVPTTDISAQHACRIATIGPSFVLAGVNTLDALRDIKINPEALARHTKEGQFLGVFAFTEEAYSDDANFAARCLVGDGIGEDPATGSANAAFATLLCIHGRQGRFIVEQGFEIHRPSRIHLDINNPIRIGGHIRPVLTGTFDTDVRRPPAGET